MKVYRYEDPVYRTGPYNGYHAVSYKLNAVHQSGTRQAHTHLGWKYDTNLDRIKSKKSSYLWWAACPSRKTLGDWFRGFHGELRRTGYVLAEYDVPDSEVVISTDGRQVAFNSSKVISRREILR